MRLDPLRATDVDDLYPLLADPEVYAAGYVMHRRPTSVDDARTLVGERFLIPGRLAHAVRLVADGTLVGTSSLLDADPANESIHIGPRCTAARGGALR